MLHGNWTKCLLKERIKPIIKYHRYVVHGQVTITESSYYEIKEQLRKYCSTGFIPDPEFRPIIQEMGYEIDRLPPIDQRGEDGFDNALDD